MINVILVDDDLVVTTSLKTILEADDEIAVVGIGHDGADAIELYKEKNPDVCLFDIRMKEKTGIEAAQEIKEFNADAKILFLTTFSDDEYIISAIRMGAKGYILKQDFDKIVPAIKAANLGQTVLGNEIIHRLPSLMGKEEVQDFSEYGIEPKEQEIIAMVADGLSNKEIAETIFLSEGTVRNYISVILEKLSLRDRTQLAVFYYRNRKTK